MGITRTENQRLLAIASLILFVLSGRTALFAQGGGQNIKPPSGSPRPNRLVQPMLRKQKVAPELEQILLRWQQETADIKTLEGEHKRATYDTVFFVAKLSEGHFYFEAPDKGRIDLKKMKVKAGATTKKANPNNGNTDVFTVQGDRSEMWISDGAFITQVDLERKDGSRYPIPPNMQGASVIDGPLPFLFGMKAEKAKQRYHIELKENSKRGIWLYIEPRLRQDRANYKYAQVFLDQDTYLPKHVQLMDPAGTKETLFSFAKLKVNDRGNIITNILGNDPFRPKLRDYKIVTYRSVVPSLIGLSWSNATKLLAQAGFNVEQDVQPKRGIAATQQQLKWVVYEQQPLPRTPLVEGQKIILTLYDVPVQRTQAPQQRTQIK